MFGRKTRAKKLKAEARNTSLISGATLAAAYGGMRPILERLLYDDDLRDNIRTLIESARNILDELSDEKPAEVVARLWDDDKLRREVEAAAGAAQEGAKRMRGQKVKSGGGAGRFLLVPALAGVGFLFLHPRTGPEARRIARDALSTFRSAS